MTTLAEEMSGRWPSLYSDLVPELRDALERPNGRHGCPGPHHQSVNGDAFKFMRDWRETGGGLCNTCGPHPNGFVMLRWIFDTDAETVRKIVGEWLEGKGARVPRQTEKGVQRDREDDKELSKWLRGLWRRGAPLADRRAEVARSYLVARGLPEWLILRAGNLRGVPALRVGKGQDRHFPAMLALYQSPQGLPVAIHRTWCTDTGKAPIEHPKKTTPHRRDRPMRGGAVRLFKPMNGVLGIAEGIETAFAAALIGNMPVWSCLFDNGIATFEPPPGVRELHVWGDPDKAGFNAGKTLKERLADSPVRLHFHYPRIPGQDWLDVWNDRQARKRGVA